MAKSPSKSTALLDTNMLAYSRSLQITEGLLFGGRGDSAGDRLTPIEVLEKGVRGQTSHDNAKDKAGLSNPQSVEYAIVPTGCDSVTLKFGLRVMPNAMKPHACNDNAVADAYQRLAKGYHAAGGFDALAELYVWNIANARFAWRNRFQSDKMVVDVGFEGRQISFDPSKLRLDTPDSRSDLFQSMTSGTADDLNALIDGVARGLSESVFSANVLWVAKMDQGQEIFPSQEYVREEKSDKNLSRVYAKIPAMSQGRHIQQASMHSQKIGAALRHIDIWHGDAVYGAIAVNPYGGVQETSAVLRNPKSKQSFFDIRKNADEMFEEVLSADNFGSISGRTHFFMANLVRGGVLGGSSKPAAE